MLLIGESLNVISTKIGRAFKERNPIPIQEEAKNRRNWAWTLLISIWALPGREALN